MVYIVKVLFISLFISTSLLAKDFVLVTDLDDTLKVTNGKRVPSMILNAAVRTKVFTGMPELFKEIISTDAEKSYVLTASPTVVGYNVKRLLRKHNIRVNGIYLRPLKELFKKREYKISRLERIIKNTKGKLILFGDNQSIDFEIYLEVKRRYPNRVDKIFIHKIHDKPLPNTVIPYVTTLEIIAELKHVLDDEQIERITKRVLSEKRLRRITPRFAYCPKSHWIDSSEERILKFQDKINKYCKDR